MRVPQTRCEWRNGAAKGEAKLEAATAEETQVRLLPGVDFRRKNSPQTVDRAFFPASAGAAMRHGWTLQRRRRPECPHMGNAPVPNRAGEDTESNAKLTMTYFRAWTLEKQRGTKHVPYIRQLRGLEETWEKSLRRWLLQLPCEETKRYVGNFLAVYRVRPEADMENSDNEDDKEELTVTEELITEACQTHVPVNEAMKESKWSKHRSLIVEALQQAEQQWGGKGYAKPMQREAENPYVDTECKDIVKGLHRNKTPSLQGARWSTMEPSVTQRPVQLSETLRKLDAWSQDLREGKCNSQQAEFCRRIVEQMKAEMQSAEGATPEPLRWALHGGPGTGKSHTLKLIREELFEQIAGWTRGSQYQIVTLQAVMANDLDGDTIHHALGLNWQSASDDKISGSKFLDLSAKAVQWRWLIVDEISMVSAELLARLDLRCRELVRDLAQSKYARGSAHARPFGGLNVILAGDLWQLPPPRGTFLGEVPWEMLTSGKSRKVAHTVHGQELVWGSLGEKSVVQGLTELVQCERTRDVWLQHLQKQIREGRLAADSHAFLHGHDTSVPGTLIFQKSLF